MIALAALAGALIIGGLVLGVRELAGRVPPPGTPPPRRPFAGLSSDSSARQWLVAVVVGLGVFAITRWPVGGVAGVLAVIFLPRVLSTRRQRQRTAKLEGLEQWTRRLGDMLTASRGLEEALEASARSAPAAIREPVTTLAARLNARTGTQAALRAGLPPEAARGNPVDMVASATAELVRAEVRHGRTRAVTGLEDTLVALHLAVLAAQPWSQPDS